MTTAAARAIGAPHALPAYRIMHRARGRVHRAVARGELVRPADCEWCGSADGLVMAHHEDYGRWWEVRWLCGYCHAVVHWRESGLVAEAIRSLIRGAPTAGNGEIARAAGSNAASVHVVREGWTPRPPPRPRAPGVGALGGAS